MLLLSFLSILDFFSIFSSINFYSMLPTSQGHRIQLVHALGVLQQPQVKVLEGAALSLSQYQYA